jgi:hypothetical protein
MNSILKIIWNSIFNLTGLDISFGAIYKDWSFYLIEMKADYQRVKDVLSERHFEPKESGEGETRIQIVGCDMRDVQIVGSYHEVSIQVPVKPVNESSDVTYAHLYLPVTTEAARWPGVDITGFPKFIAQIEIKNKEGTLHCQLIEGGTQILEFEMDDFIGSKQSINWEYYGNRKGQIIKTIFELKGKIYEGDATQKTKLSLGEHPIADKLRKLLISDEVVRIVIGHDVSGYLRKPVLVDLIR